MDYGKKRIYIDYEQKKERNKVRKGILTADYTNQH